MRDVRQPHREREAVQRGRQLARDDLGDVVQGSVLGGGPEQHDDVAGRVGGGERAGGAGAGGALGGGEHAGAPVLVGGR